MKLQIVPARQGMAWAQLGVKTFFKQPLALSGLFFLFIAVMSLLSIVPVLGNALALALLPGLTLGLMAATQEAASGKFPMPMVLFSAFRAGKPQLQAMGILGGIYAAGFLLLMAASAVVDGGQVARLYLLGGAITPEVLQEGNFQIALLVAMALYLPLSMLFWHAPALAHWHGISPVKSLFFSMVACLRNFWAFTVYGVVWIGIFMAIGMVIATVAALTGSPELITLVMFPAAMLMAAMFFTSIYFTFQDCFDFTSGESE